MAARSAGPTRAGPWIAAGLVLALAAGITLYDALWRPAGPAPDFALTSTGFEDGVQGEPVAFSLSEYRGKVVVLDMMAVNCLACRIVTEETLKPLWAAHAGSGDLAILSIDTWADDDAGQDFGFETASNLVALQKEEGVPWRHALDSDDVWRKYQAVALPKVVVVDREGQIVYESGPRGPDAGDVRRAVADALEGSPSDARVLRLPLLGLAGVAGVAAFFSPCSVGLIPAYFGLLLTRRVEGAAGAAATVAAGLSAAAGAMTLYLAVAAVLLAGGAWLAGHLDTVQALTGFLLVGLGLLMLRRPVWGALARRLGLGSVDGRRGLFAFGVGFGLASFGCTGPIFLPVLLDAFARGAATGMAALLLYGGAMAALMVLAAGLVASGHHNALRAILSRAVWVHRVAAALFVTAGAYVLYFHYRATGSLW